MTTTTDTPRRGGGRALALAFMAAVTARFVVPKSVSSWVRFSFSAGSPSPAAPAPPPTERPSDGKKPPRSTRT